MSSPFCIGDRVEYVVPGDYLAGKTGTIAAFSGDSIGVCFDEQIPSGHDLFGHCESGHG